MFALLPEQVAKAQEVLAKVRAPYDGDAADLPSWNVVCEFDERGLWLHHDESIDLEQLEELVSELLDALEIDLPFICTWASTCSKPRLDAFGGGGFRAQRGKPTYWMSTEDLLNEPSADATLAVQELAVLKEALADPETLGKWVREGRIATPQGYVPVNPDAHLYDPN
jgi:hypothetical protein